MNRRNTKKPHHASALRMVIESLETRAMLAGVGPESWSAPGLAPAPLSTGSLFSSGVILTCSSPTPGSSGTASPPAPTSGSGTTSGGDLWLAYSAGSGAGGSKSGSTGGVSTDGPALSSQYNGGSGAGGQGNGTGGTLSNADLWRLYWSGAGAGSSSSSSDEGSLADDPAISAQYTGGSGIGRITPLVYNPESDGPPVFHSGVFTGDHGSVQFVQTTDTGNQGTGEGDEPKDESEPPAKSWWGWFIGDDPIKGSLWKQGPSRISRAGDRPTHNDDKSAVESLEDGGKLAKEVIDGAKRDGSLAAVGAVVGKLGAQNGVPKARTVNGIKAPGLFDDTVGSLDEARAAIKKAFPDAVELPPALPGKPYPSPPPGVKKWFQVHPPEPGVGNDLPHIKYVDWTTGKKGTGGSWGHLFFLD